MFQAINDEDINALQEILKEQSSQLHNARTEEGDFALHVAARVRNTEIIKHLMESGAKVDLQNKECQTALHIAVYNEDGNMVNCLLDHGAKYDIPDKDGVTVEQLASTMGKTEIIEKLQNITLARPVIVAPENVAESLLQAVRSEDVKAVSDLFDFGLLNEDVHEECRTENGDTSLHIAARLKNIEICRTLITSGAKADEKNVDGNTALHLAAELGDISLARFLNSVKAKANVINNDGDTPLHVACRKKHVNIVELLLGKFNANINITNKKGNTPLFVAVRSNCTQAIKALLNSSQADQDVRSGKSANGDTLLHIAAYNKDTELAKLLVQWGTPPDEQNNVGRTPLHVAAHKGDEEMVKYLQTVKANPNTLDNEEMTPIHVAAMAGHHSIVLFFLEKFKADPSARNRDGSTLLHLACKAGQMDTSNVLIKKGVLTQMPNKSGSLCIHEAARKGHVGLVKMLLEKGVPVNTKNKKRYTPLHLAALSKKHLVVQLLIGYGADITVVGGVANETPLHMASKVKGSEKVVDVLIKSGADPDAAKQNGERALHLAARCGNFEVVKLLLREDTEVARRTRTGETPIHLACQNGHYEIVKALVEKVFQVKSKALARLIVNIPNAAGETALHFVAGIAPSTKSTDEEVVNVVQILLEHSANLALTTYQKKETPLHWCARSGNYQIMEEFFTSGYVPEHVKLSTINKASERGASPLMLASECGMLEVVRVLLRFHARVDVFDEVGGTALHYAASKGHVEVARALLNNRAYVNGRTKPNVRSSAHKTGRGKDDDDDDNSPIGLTPLHIAADKGHADFVRVLVTKYNAIVDLVTVDKKTPLHLASESGRTDVCRVLLDLRADASVGDSKDMIPVHYAAAKDHDEVVELFFKVQPSTMTQINAEGLNVLQIAASKGSIKVVRKLVELDFAKCSADKGVFCKPLLLAARGGHKEMVEFLLVNGASPTEEDSEGMSVLHLAAKFGQLKVIDMLWGKTPIEQVSVKNGMTAIHVAALFGQTDIVQEFLSRAPKSATFVSEKPANGEEQEEEEEDYGFTPLHLSSQNGDNTLVRVLTNHPGVRIDAVTLKMGRTALHVAAFEGHIEVASTLISKATLLLHQVDKDGRTPLHLASANGHKDLLTIMIGQGAEIDAKDNMGNTALHIAAAAGYQAVVKLLMEYGASPLIENEVLKNEDLKSRIASVSIILSEDVAICNAAKERHIEVLDFLLTQKLNHERLLSNRKFLVDLVSCSRTCNHKPLMNFILSAPAPVHMSSFLSRHYRIEISKNKELATDLDMASSFCESMAKDLISISCVENSGAVLNSIDERNVAFLDFLIECELKQCVSHPLVQQYVSQIWFGELKWEDWKLMLLFLVALLFPPFWVYLSLPFKNRHRQIPVIRFICRLISHLYLILLLCLTAVVPWKYSGTMLAPHWYDYFLYIWIIGMLLAEITSGKERSGPGWFPIIVILLVLVAELLRIVAVGFDKNPRLGIAFARNQFLGAALMLSVLQLLEFLSIHRLFGPWGVIIGHLIVDVARFLLIFVIFFSSFLLQLLAVLKPLDDLDEDDNSYKTVSTSPSFFKVGELLFFGLFGLAPQSSFSTNRPSHIRIMTEFVFGMYNVLIIIVLINLLIAMMSDTYQRLQEQSDVEWKFGRAKLIRNMERETSNPIPINLFSKLIHIFKILYKTRCRCRKVEIASEESNLNGSTIPMQRRRKSKNPTVEDGVLGDASTKEWDLIYSVVDWLTIAEKYLDSKGEIEPRKRGRGQNRRERRRTLMPTPIAQRQGKDNRGFQYSDVADATIVKMNVVNSLRV